MKKPIQVAVLKPAAGAGPEELSSDTVKFLQGVAWDMVQDYHRK
jgi:hypothetical protein